MCKPYEKPTAHELTHERLTSEERELLTTFCKSLLEKHNHEQGDKVGNYKDHQKFIQLANDCLDILSRQVCKPDVESPRGYTEDSLEVA